MADQREPRPDNWRLFIWLFVLLLVIITGYFLLEAWVLNNTR